MLVGDAVVGLPRMRLQQQKFGSRLDVEVEALASGSPITMQSSSVKVGWWGKAGLGQQSRAWEHREVTARTDHPRPQVEGWVGQISGTFQCQRQFHGVAALPRNAHLCLTTTTATPGRFRITPVATSLSGHSRLDTVSEAPRNSRGFHRDLAQTPRSPSHPSRPTDLAHNNTFPTILVLLHQRPHRLSCRT